MTTIFVLETPVLFVFLNILTFSCSLAACSLPWYFVGNEDLAIGSENKWKLSFFQLSNVTSLAAQTDTSSTSYDQAPHVFTALMISFGFQLASTVLAFGGLCLSVIYILKNEKLPPAKLKKLGMAMNICGGLVALFTFVAIFQFVFSLRWGFTKDENALATMSNCGYDLSICNSFMNRITETNEVWYWGPHFGWLLGLTSCLFSFGGLATSAVLLQGSSTQPSVYAQYQPIENE